MTYAPNRSVLVAPFTWLAPTSLRGHVSGHVFTSQLVLGLAKTLRLVFVSLPRTKKMIRTEKERNNKQQKHKENQNQKTTQCEETANGGTRPARFFPLGAQAQVPGLHALLAGRVSSRRGVSVAYSKRGLPKGSLVVSSAARNLLSSALGDLDIKGDHLLAPSLKLGVPMGKPEQSSLVG